MLNITPAELAALDTLVEMADAVLNLTYAAEDWRGSREGRIALATVEGLISRAKVAK
jgi:hypothetical protein